MRSCGWCEHERGRSRQIRGWLTPCSRHRSAAFLPASCSRSIPTICVSVNLLFLMLPKFRWLSLLTTVPVLGGSYRGSLHPHTVGALRRRHQYSRLPARHGAVIPSGTLSVRTRAMAGIIRRSGLERSRRAGMPPHRHAFTMSPVPVGCFIDTSHQLSTQAMGYAMR